MLLFWKGRNKNMEEIITIIFISLVGIYILYQKIIKGKDRFQEGGDEYNEID